jgi:hypothetical protein
MDDDRPPPPDPNAVWDGAGWRVLSSAEHVADLERVRPCPGVAPGAARRHDDEPAVPWRLLDARLQGIDQRRGRAGEQWIWSAGRSAQQTMHDVRQQTARALDLTRHDLREPTWLRDDALGLSPRELRLIVSLVCAYEAGWGGLFDCQSTVAADLGLGSERTLRNMLRGTKWTRPDGTRGYRPGLIERGFVEAIQCWKPGRADARPSDHDWLLLRIGPTIERAAAWATLAKAWTARAPRGTGWTRRVARSMAAGLRGRAGRERYSAAGRAWSARPRPSSATSENRAPTWSTRPHENRTSSSSSRPSENRAHAEASPTSDFRAPPAGPRPASENRATSPIGDLVDLDLVGAALEGIRRGQAGPRVTPDELAEARAECERLRSDPELARELAEDFEQSFAVVQARRERREELHRPARPSAVHGADDGPVNWAASVADNPATPGPTSWAPGDGVGGSGGTASPAQGRPLSSQGPPLALRPDFGPSFANAAGAVRPNGAGVRASPLAPSGGSAGAASGPGLTERLAARGGAAAEAAAAAEDLKRRNPELAHVLLQLGAAWALDD